MGFRLVCAATLCLLLVACGKSEESDKGTSAARDSADTQATADQQQPATESVAPAAKSEEKTVDGEAVYKRACISCHMTGAAGAPKVGDTVAWEQRIAKGADALVQSAISGLPGTAMMAKGACTSCSDEEVIAAVHYMTEQTVYDASQVHNLSPVIGVADGAQLTGDYFPLVWERKQPETAVSGRS